MISSTRSKWAVVIVLVAPSLGASMANAHDSHNTRIQRLEHQISHLHAGEAVELLLQRADLHRRQSAWDAALHDYQSVATLEPDNIELALGLAKMHLDQKQFQEAMEWSTRALNIEPTVAQGGLVQARALAGMGDYNSAAAAYNGAMKILSNPRPEHYLEQAQIVSADVSNPNSHHNAIAILDKGIDQLGNLVSLNKFAYELELKAGDREAALRRIDRVLAHNGSLLNWRMQRSELLLELGQLNDARNTALCLIHSIQKLPQQRRNSQVFTNLMARSQKLVEHIHAESRDASFKIDDTSDSC